MRASSIPGPTLLRIHAMWSGRDSMRRMRQDRIRSASLAGLGWAVTALLATVAACRPAGTAAPAPVNVPAPTTGDDAALAADAGTYMAFLSGDGDIPPAVMGWRAQQWEMFGA